MTDRPTFRSLALVLPLLAATPLVAQSPADAPAKEAPAPEAPAAPLPGAEEISKRHLAAIGGEEAVRKHAHSTMKGTVSMPAMGLSGPTTVYASDPDRYLMVVTLPGAGEVRSGFDGTVAWSEDQMQGPRLMEGGELAQIKREANFRRDLDILAGWDSVKVTGREDFGGVPCVAVEVTGGGETSRFYFDDATGLFRGSRMSTASPLGKIQVETVVSDYRDFDGMRVPVRTELSMMGQKQVLAIDSVAFDPIDPKVFELPPAVQALVTKPAGAGSPKPAGGEAPKPADPATPAPDPTPKAE